MSLYLSEHERSALASINSNTLRELVDEAVWTTRSSALRELRLASCGVYVAERLRRFERDLDSYAKAKSAQKRSDTRARASSAGSELVRALREMQDRMATEDKELERFRIDDLIPPPHRLRERIEVRVGFQWRDTASDSWRFGSITFAHDVQLRPDYEKPVPKRKPSAAKQDEERQDELYRRWEDLRSRALGAVREFFQKGGDGAAIPERFEAQPGMRSRFLDNFSCDFWLDRAAASGAAG
ncbi:hypothetical protein JW805_03170 [Roseomonas aeriglobus]|nr:hypothetical protein [Roseomonas aeriglobus]